MLAVRSSTLIRAAPSQVILRHTAVCFSAMSDVVDNNCSLFAMNAIDDPVIAHSQAV
jgi:hypothetical protein